MKLTYIYHSGFILEGETFTAVIDFYKGDERLAGLSELLQTSKGAFYVLSSHAHSDHFNSEVLKWQKIRPDIRFIFSDDIKEKVAVGTSGVRFLHKRETYGDGIIQIKAFGSTDVGISFLIEAEGKRIFHAGDLNNWHWKAESTPEEVEKAEQDYLREVEELRQETGCLDLAMFPVDPRMGTDYMLGACQFVDRIRVNYFVPMHFWERYAEAAAFRTYAERRGSVFVELMRSGQSVKF